MSTQDILVRGEQPGDESQIDLVLSRAFDGMDEANLVRMLRHRQPGFDRSLCICAFVGDVMVGYTGFIPFGMRLMDSSVSAVAVAPVAVAPDFQRRGIAGMMLRRGHEVAQEAGYRLACLNGHPDYYPRHGYIACFGFCKTMLDLDVLPAPRIELEAWPVQADDIAWLIGCDEREWHSVDFTWPRSNGLCEWAIEGVNAVMWRARDGRRAAYSLCRPGLRGPGRHLETLLGDDPELVQEVIAHIKPGRITNHPAGWLAKNVLNESWAKCEANSSQAAMAYPLVDGVLDPYLAALESGQRQAGTCNWPVPFIMC